jgi:methyl coenzyme M reductase gamma subunit
MHAYIHTYIHTYAYTHPYIHTHTYIYTYTHTHTHTYTHTHITYRREHDFSEIIQLGVDQTTNPPCPIKDHKVYGIKGKNVVR